MRKRWIFRLSVLSLVAGACWVRSAAWQWPFLFDDLQHIGLCLRVERGEIPLWDLVRAPHNEHWMPLWRLGYFASWKMFGNQVEPWHAILIAFYVLSTLLIFALGRHGWRRPTAAWATAGMWAVCSFRSWDNPADWIAASHLFLATTGLLATLLVFAKLPWLRHPRVGLVAMLLLASLTILTMGSFVILLPAVGLWWWTVERPRIPNHPKVWEKFRRQLSAILPLMLVVGLWFLMQTIAMATAPFWAGLRSDFSIMTQRIELFVEGLRNGRFFLAFFSTQLAGLASILGATDLIAGFVFAVWLLLAIVLRAPIGPALPFVAMSVVFSLMVAASRHVLSNDILSLSGRYCFLSSLAWCWLLGAVLAGIESRLISARQRMSWTLFLTIALVALAVRQFLFTGFSTQLLWSNWGRHEAYLKQTINIAHSFPPHRKIVMLDFPVVCETSLFFTLGTLFEAFQVDHPRVRLIRLDEFPSPELEDSTNWLSLWPVAHTDYWTENQVQAAFYARLLVAQRDLIERVPIPNAQMRFGDWSYSLQEIAAMIDGFDSPLVWKSWFVEQKDWNHEHLLRFNALLESLTEADAHQWRAVLEDLKWIPKENRVSTTEKKPSPTGAESLAGNASGVAQDIAQFPRGFVD